MVPILIVDDSSDDRALAEGVFAKARLANPIQTFGGGEEFLSYVETRLDFKALVLLDLVMDPVSGLDVLRSCEKRAHPDQLTFVMLSGQADYKLLKEGYRLGARSFLTKPLKSETLLAQLQDIDGLSVQTTSGGPVLVIRSPETSGAEAFWPASKI